MTARPGAPWPDPSASLPEQAAWWVVQLGECDPPPPALVEACQRWCEADPRHAEAYAGIARMWSAWDGEAPRRVPSTKARARTGLPGRRRGAHTALAAVLVLVLGAELPWGVWTADERTAPAERRRITLADGSRLLLAGGTALDVEFDASGRALRLRRGEVDAEVAPDPTRPFRILTPDGSVQALGTRYAVRLEPGGSRVSVEESIVEVRPREAGAGVDPVRVSAGQATRFDAAHAEAPAPLAANAWAWREGRLVFADAPVAEVLHELARHRAGWLVVDEPALHGVRFTGVLPADEPEEALALLNDALPLRVVRLTRYAVHVGRRAP